MQETPGGNSGGTDPIGGTPAPATPSPILSKDEGASTVPPHTAAPGASHATPGTGTTKPLVARVRDILMHPNTEWGVIDAEPSTVQSIMMGYVLILAAIGPLAMLIGQQLFGYSILGVTYRPGLGYSIAMALMTYIGSVASTYVLAMVIDALAPNFGGTKNMTQAFKVAAYAGTPGWVAGALLIIPMLGVISWLGAIYGIYLIYLGLPRLMRVSADKAVGYTVVAVVVEFVLLVVIGIVVAAIVGSMFPFGGLSGASIR